MLENAEPRLPGHRRREVLGRRPRKLMRVEVVVPTLRQVISQLVRSGGGARTLPDREPSDSQEHMPAIQVKSEEEDVKMYFLLQASIKVDVKPKQMISDNVVRDRLALIDYDTFDIKVPQDILGVTTTREVTSRIWGGNKRSVFPKISKEFNHGLDDFMYISPLFNPYAPRWPGSPGLIFEFKDDVQEWPKIMRLLVRLRDGVWQYMGQYELTAAPPLSPSEWNTQSIKVKRMWANTLAEKKTDCDLKAKIVLRKRFGRDPTPLEMEVALRSKQKFHVSADEILRACDEGLVVVHVWCMKCVGYDVNFQKRIATGSRKHEHLRLVQS